MQIYLLVLSTVGSTFLSAAVTVVMAILEAASVIGVIGHFSDGDGDGFEITVEYEVQERSARRNGKLYTWNQWMILDADVDVY